MTEPIDYMALMAVNVPEGAHAGASVERFTVPPIGQDRGSGMGEQMRAMRHGRDITPGTYTRLILDGRLIMSDTPAERLDHYPAVIRMADPSCHRVLLNGLGLGMVLRAALTFAHVEHVDVVENDARVIALVGTHYAHTPDPRVSFHLADALTMPAKWPAGTRWDVGWSDIWPDLCTDHLAEMNALRASYGHRCTWHDCWCRELLLSYRRRGM